jgi:hypothetical protein
LVIELQGAGDGESSFALQVEYLMDLEDGSRPRPVATEVVPPDRTGPTPGGHTSLVIARIDTAAYNTLGLVITRIDAKERADPRGRYAVTLRTPN